MAHALTWIVEIRVSPDRVNSLDGSPALAAARILAKVARRHSLPKCLILLTIVGLPIAKVDNFKRAYALCGGVMPNFTTREIEVLTWIASGKSDWQIGQILNISDKTVNFHVENMKRKCGVATRIQVVVRAVQQGKIQPT